jgi:HK97 family phage portal protein
MNLFESMTKAIKKPFEKKSISASSKYLFLFNGAMYNTSYSNVKQAREGFVSNIIVFRCISLITMQAAQLNYKLFKKSSKGNTEIEDHPLLDLLNNPYPSMAKNEFLRKLFTYYLIYGQAYTWLKYPFDDLTFQNKPPVFLYPLRPDKMEIKEGENFLPKYYKYQDEYQTLKFDVSMLGQSNIIHMKTVNPLDEFTGLSPTFPAAYPIDQHNESSIWNLGLLKNGARPSGILKVPADVELKETDRQRLKQEITDLHSNSDNAGKAMLLTGGIEWTQLSLSPQDMDNSTMEKSSAHKIGLGYNVPIELLNTEQAKYDNLLAAYEQLYDEAVEPLIQAHITEYNMNLTPRYDKSLFLVADTSHLTALMIRRSRKMEALEKVTYLTINEKRKSSGYDDTDGGDDILVDMNKIPLADLGSDEFGTSEDKKNFVKNDRK